MTTAAKLDPFLEALEAAPLAGADDFTPDERAHLAEVYAEPAGHALAHAEVMRELAERAKREG